MSSAQQDPPVQNLSPKNSSPQNLWRKRLPVIGLMVVFFAPVIVAYGYLSTGYYQTLGTKNKGNLIEQPIDFNQIGLKRANGEPISTQTLHSNWWLVYRLPEQCLDACQQRLLQIRQAIQAIGSDKSRVRPLILRSSQRPHPELEYWKEQTPHVVVAQVSAQDLQEKVMSKAPLESLIVMDPLGFGMLHFETVTDPDKAIQQAKQLVKDVKYLLKVSRIG